jgi:lon-related putative ATP-dependent protease
MAKMHKGVPVEQLRWHCDPKSLKVKSTEDVHPTKEIIGQDRALHALKLGLQMKHPGYNVFVTGFSGTGRMTTIKMLLSEFQHQKVQLSDHCYVNNFRNTDQPILISLPAGDGIKFQEDMDVLIQDLLRDVPAAFESRRFKEDRKRSMEFFQERQRSVLKDFEQKVRERGFEVIQVQVGPIMRPDIAPVFNGQPIAYEQLDLLVKEGKVSKEQIEKMMKDRTQLEGQMELVLRELRNIDRKAKESVSDLSEQFILPIIKEYIDAIRAKHKCDKLQRYLDEVQESIMGDLNRFYPEEQPPQIPGAPTIPQEDEDLFIEYKVNVVVDNSRTNGVPIVIETNPRFKNLFGTIEREVDRNGIWRTDFTLIKSGSLLRAHGGFLVINALDAIVEPGVWQTLKRTLRNCLLEIQPIDGGMFGTSSAFKPEPIHIDIKVVMLGDAFIYYFLYDQDDDFKKIFKVRADFDTEMNRQTQSIQKYVQFIKMICNDEKLLPFDSSGIASVIEHGVRLAGRQNKLSTRFNLIADILREANYWASHEKETIVSARHITKAIAERIERIKLVEDKTKEMIVDGTLLIDTEGSVTGQVNGLSVIDMREYMFGIPTRITAKTSIGKEGVINIEREAAMSGPLHNKGVLIISGYLHGMYAHNKPLAMNASITFEQNYGGVDGDSASSTEIYAIISSLADVPIRQDIAVTGSVNQNGEIQPIGGVNEKIEGFFDLCNKRGLKGTEGVLVPHQNKKDLMLRQDVVDAVRKGKFHIYAVKTIEDGIEILMSRPAGKRLRNGTFEINTVHYLADQTLIRYAQHWKSLLI